MKTQHNLLTEPLLRIRLATNGQVEHATLPAILEHLGEQTDVEFPGLMAHQEHAWHVFLVQLAVIALASQSESDPKQHASWWANVLRGLTDGDEAWCLVVEDLKKPAFMQPPVPEGDLKGFKNKHVLASDIDVIIDSKNHDVKRGRLEQAEPEHWFYALLMLQTFEGFLGRGNYGVCRMNGGFASRCVVAWSPEPTTGSRFWRDTQVLLEHRVSTSQAFGQPLTGLTLLWTVPWDGAKPIGLDECAPYFIEVCRRVRMVASSEMLRTATTAARILQEAHGVVGDPWTPIVTKDHKALNVPSSGFGYRRMASLLSEDLLTFAVANRLSKLDGVTPVLRASVLSRGQGTIEGLHVREIRVPTGAKRTFFSTDATPTELLGERIKLQIGAAKDTQRKVLHPALCVLIQGAPGKLNLKDERTQPFIERHDHAVDGLFFEALWSSESMSNTEHKAYWETRLFEEAEHVLSKASEALPQSESRHPRTLAAAERVFYGSARNHLTAWAAQSDVERAARKAAKTKKDESAKAQAKDAPAPLEDTP